MTILIAITGGSGSGKSTLAEALVSSLPEGVATLLREDAYYLDAASVPGFDAATHDFDDVAARDHDLLIADLSALKSGRAITAPVYSFIHHGREPQGEPVTATDVVIVEVAGELGGALVLEQPLETAPGRIALRLAAATARLVEIADHAVHVDVVTGLEDLLGLFVVEFVGFRFFVHGTKYSGSVGRNLFRADPACNGAT